MTETLNEQLSAFLDGELPEAETTLLLKRLQRDDELKNTLSRYSLIGEVMRAEGDLPAARHVAARVSAAIAREPELRPGRSARWVRPAAGMALAASVAMAAVMLLPQWFAAGGGEPVTVAENGGGTVEAVSPVAADPAAIGVVQAAAEAPPIIYTTPPAAAEPAGGLPSAQLASYLVAHSEYTLPLSRRSVVIALQPETDEPQPQEQPEAEAAR